MREEVEAPPGVLCNQHLENSWKEECVFVVHMCFFAHSDIFDLSFVCFCLHI